MSPPRWSEYTDLLATVLDRGYRVISLERFIFDPPDTAQGPCLILRHDVDQHPRSALKMARIELAAGVSSTWYFRWRTADPGVVGTLRRWGFEIGFHYETLSRTVLERQLSSADVTPELLDECRERLGAEAAQFEQAFGPIRTVCPHGDTRVPGINNGVLVRDGPAKVVGGLVDANEAMRGRGLAAWLTDRSIPEGRWGTSPHALLQERSTPVLCLTHPNNWAAGTGLLLDRVLGASVPSRLRFPIRTRGDSPPR